MLLETKNVEKRFGGLVAVNGVSLQVGEGEIVGVIGPNGAGKTTLLNCIAGFYRPDRGKIFFRGRDVTGFSQEKLCRLGISRTFQNVRGFPKMTALENVMVGCVFGAGKTKDAGERARSLLEFVQFPLAEDTPAENCNTIQLKRLELARSLATDCRLLLLDEVAAGLTPAELPDFMGLVRKIRDSGVTILCIEHLMRFITGVCDRVAALEFGTKIADGSPQEVLSNEEVVRAYLGKTDVH